MTNEEKEFKASREDIGILTEYLNEIRKLSHGSYQNTKSIIIHFINLVKKPLGKIKVEDVKNYFLNVFDKKKLKLATKKEYQSRLKSFFLHVTNNLIL